MKNPLIYLKKVFRFVALKIRYGKCCDIGLIQSFEKVRFDITNKGTVTLGSYNQNRELLYIGVNGGKLELGNHCFFNINSSVTAMNEIKIGDYCKFGNNLVIVDHDHNFKNNYSEFVSSPIHIGNNVWCGANVTILRGTEIGDNCVIGAGTVVKGCFPANCIICGSKGEIIRKQRE